MVAARAVSEEDEVLIVASNGVIIRLPVEDISIQGPYATGVKVMSVGDDEVAAIAPVLATDEDEEAEGEAGDGEGDVDTASGTDGAEASSTEPAEESDPAEVPEASAEGVSEADAADTPDTDE